MMVMLRRRPTPVPVEKVDLEEKKAAAMRLAEEMEDLAQVLMHKATELKEEIKRGRAESS